MTKLIVTRHASIRMQQRGIAASDVELIEMIGTEVLDGYLVLAKDCQDAERNLGRMIERIRRLEGKRLVIAEGQVITAFHARPRQGRRLLRRTSERNLEVAA